MSGCCSRARSVVVEVTVLRVDGETCDRCADTVDAVRQAVKDSDLLGQEGVCCGAVAVGGDTQESFTAEQVKEAAMVELGLAGGCGCS